MAFFIIELRQRCECCNEVIKGYLTADHMLSTLPEDAEHHDWDSAVKALAACQYEGVDVLSATIERQEIEDPQEGFERLITTLTGREKEDETIRTNESR